MRLENLDWTPSKTKLRQFGLLLLIFGIGFFVVSIPRESNGYLWHVGPIALSLAGLIGIFVPTFLRWPFVLWTLAVFPIGWTISQITLLAIFFFIFLPIGLVFRVLRRDALNLKLSNQPSFWNMAPAKIDSSRYFRQY
jgi:hypothetical protein